MWPMLFLFRKQPKQRLADVQAVTPVLPMVLAVTENTHAESEQPGRSCSLVTIMKQLS
jgi:hypothetical protein